MTVDDSTAKMNWDLTSYFPEFNGPEMKEFKEKLKGDIETAKTKASSLAPLDDLNRSEWEDVFLKNEDLVTRYTHIDSYIGCLSAADGLNEEYLREEAEMSALGAEFSKLKVELMRGVKDASGENFASLTESKALTSSKYYLGRLREDAQKKMNTEREILAADLGVDGISAWGRLYDTVSGKLEFEMAYPDGTVRTLPISQRRSLMEKPERAVRKAAFEGGNRAWQSIEDTAAAALNAIAGTRLTLNKYRGIDHFLDVALFQSSISRKTLDAMFEAIYSELELPRTILRLKAETMKRDKIAWYDLGAPLDLKTGQKLNWSRARKMVKNSFAASYPRLGKFMDAV
jgi:oligoendopeptidase F